MAPGTIPGTPCRSYNKNANGMRWRGNAYGLIPALGVAQLRDSGRFAAAAQCLPVLPKPPAPRSLSPNSSTILN